MQQINLYSQLVKPSRYRINSKQAYKIIIGWIALLLILWILQLGYFAGRQLYLSYLEMKEKSTATKLQQLLQTSPKIQRVNQINDKISQHNQKISMQMALIKNLSDYNGNSPTFSPASYFKIFANTIPKDVWLNKIRLEQQGQQVELQGLTTEAAQLNLFATALEKTAEFRDKPFKNIMINNSDDKALLSFDLTTKSIQEQKS